MHITITITIIAPKINRHHAPIIYYILLYYILLLYYIIIILYIIILYIIILYIIILYILSAFFQRELIYFNKGKSVGSLM